MPREEPQIEPLDLNILPEKYRPRVVPYIIKVLGVAAAGRRDWAGVFQAILSHDSERMRLAELYQEGSELTLAGVALSRDDVLA